MRLLHHKIFCFLLLTCFIFLANGLFAQNDTIKPQSGSDGYITYEKSGGWLIKQDGDTLTPNDLLNVLQADALSSTYVRKFKTKNGFATAFGLIGGALIGYPVGQAIGGGDPVWEVALIGVGALAIAIPLSVSANKDIKRGVDAYNEQFEHSAHTFRPSLRIGGQRHGVGLCLRF